MTTTHLPTVRYATFNIPALNQSDFKLVAHNSPISTDPRTNHRAPLEVIENTLRNQIKLESGTS